MMTHSLNNGAYVATVVDVCDDDELDLLEALSAAGCLSAEDVEAALIVSDEDALDYYLPGGDLWVCDPDYYWQALDGILVLWVEFVRPVRDVVGHDRTDGLILTVQATDDSVGRDIVSFCAGKQTGRDLEGWTRMELEEVEAGVPPIMASVAIGWTDLCRLYAVANGCAVIAYRGGCGYSYGLYRKEVPATTNS